VKVRGIHLDRLQTTFGQIGVALFVAGFVKSAFIADTSAIATVAVFAVAFVMITLSFLKLE